MDALDAKIERKKAKKDNKGTNIEVSEPPKPKKNSAPCTGMCAIMRQRTVLVEGQHFIRHVVV